MANIDDVASICQLCCELAHANSYTLLLAPNVNNLVDEVRLVIGWMIDLSSHQCLHQALAMIILAKMYKLTVWLCRFLRLITRLSGF